MTAALTVFLLLPVAASADSDGYFCIGRGYLAYETRFTAAEAGHQLHVVRFSTAGGIVAARPVPLEDFQVQRMTCRADAVELVGWNAVYSVDLSDPERPQTAIRSALFDHAQAAPAQNLGPWAREQVVNLEAADTAPGLFQLVIARVSRRVAGGVEHYTITQIVRRASAGSPAGEFAASLKLFDGVFRETVD